MRSPDREAVFAKAAELIQGALQANNRLENYKVDGKVRGAVGVPALTTKCTFVLVTDVAGGKEEHLINVLCQSQVKEYGYPIYYLSHETPFESPLIFASIERFGVSVFAEDIDSDGRPEIFVEYIVGAHTRVLQVYKFPAYGGRPFQMEGGSIGADGSIIVTAH